jgi:hypothetical protein
MALTRLDELRLLDTHVTPEMVDRLRQKLAQTNVICDDLRRGRFQSPEKLAGRRVKCPKRGQPLAIPGPHAIARPAGDLDLEKLLGADAGPAVMPSAPPPRLGKEKRRSNTGLIVGQSRLQLFHLQTPHEN